MFTITCHRCDTTLLVGERAIRSLHNTSAGPVAYVDSPCGHLTIHRFGTGESTSAETVSSPHLGRVA